MGALARAPGFQLRQPGQPFNCPVKIKKSHPLAKFLSLAYCPAHNGHVNLVTGLRAVSDAARIGVGPYGKAHYVETSSVAQAEFETCDALGLRSGSFSVFAFHRMDNGGANHSIFQCANGAFNAGWEFLNNSTTAMRVHRPFVALSSAFNDGVGTADAWKTSGLTWTIGSSGWGYYNGVETSLGSMGCNDAGGTATLKIGRTDNASAGRGLWVAVAYAFKGVLLTAAMQRALHEDPWQLLEPAGEDDVAAKATTATVYTMPAAAGAYTVTGQAARLAATRKIAAAVGTFTVSGQNAGVKRSYLVSATVTPYTLSGIAAALQALRRFTATVVPYNLTGIDAALTSSSRNLVASVGTFTLTGRDANLLIHHAVTATVVTYALNGQAVNLLRQRSMPAAIGTFALSGIDANFRRTYAVQATVTPYNVVGINVTLTPPSRLAPVASGGGQGGQDPRRRRRGRARPINRWDDEKRREIYARAQRAYRHATDPQAPAAVRAEAQRVVRPFAGVASADSALPVSAIHWADLIGEVAPLESLLALANQAAPKLTPPAPIEEPIDEALILMLFGDDL